MWVSSKIRLLFSWHCFPFYCLCIVLGTFTTAPVALSALQIEVEERDALGPRSLQLKCEAANSECQQEANVTRPLLLHEITGQALCSLAVSHSCSTKGDRGVAISHLRSHSSDFALLCCKLNWLDGSCCGTENKVRLAFGTVTFSVCQQLVQPVLNPRRAIQGNALCGL